MPQRTAHSQPAGERRRAAPASARQADTGCSPDFFLPRHLLMSAEVGGLPQQMLRFCAVRRLLRFTMCSSTAAICSRNSAMRASLSGAPPDLRSSSIPLRFPRWRFQRAMSSGTHDLPCLTSAVSSTTALRVERFDRPPWITASQSLLPSEPLCRNISAGMRDVSEYCARHERHREKQGLR